MIYILNDFLAALCSPFCHTCIHWPCLEFSLRQISSTWRRFVSKHRRSMVTLVDCVMRCFFNPGRRTWRDLQDNALYDVKADLKRRSRNTANDLFSLFRISLTLNWYEIWLIKWVKVEKKLGRRVLDSGWLNLKVINKMRGNYNEHAAVLGYQSRVCFKIVISLVLTKLSDCFIRRNGHPCPRRGMSAYDKIYKCTSEYENGLAFWGGICIYCCHEYASTRGSHICKKVIKSDSRTDEYSSPKSTRVAFYYSSTRQILLPVASFLVHVDHVP